MRKRRVRRSGSRLRFGLVSYSIPVAQLAEQSQQLDVEQDESDEQAEGAVQFHVLRGAPPYAVLDEIEVENEIERGQDDDEQRKPDADDSRAVDQRNRDVEESQNHAHEVEEAE